MPETRVITVMAAPCSTGSRALFGHHVTLPSRRSIRRKDDWRYLGRQLLRVFHCTGSRTRCAWPPRRQPDVRQTCGCHLVAGHHQWGLESLASNTAQLLSCCMPGQRCASREDKKLRIDSRNGWVIASSSLPRREGWQAAISIMPQHPVAAVK
jgi:hypothetical protein